MVAYLGWIYYEPRPQDEVIWGVVTYAPYSNHFEAAPICPNDVVTSWLHHYALSHLRPRLNVPVPPALPEVVEDVHQTELAILSIYNPLNSLDQWEVMVSDIIWLIHGINNIICEINLVKLDDYTFGQILLCRLPDHDKVVPGYTPPPQRYLPYTHLLDELGKLKKSL